MQVNELTMLFVPHKSTVWLRMRMLFGFWLLVVHSQLCWNFSVITVHITSTSSGVTLGLVLHVAAAKSVSAKIINQATGRTREKEKEREKERERERGVRGVKKNGPYDK